MIIKRDRNVARRRRHLRVRAKITGTAERPRMGVFRSSKHIYAQLVDDAQGRTVAAASSLDPDLRARGGELGDPIKVARAVGKLVAERALAKGLTEIVFDRSGYIYHGRVAAVAEAAREAGLKF
jgi:large subunit ribosomal protein L18